MAIDRHSNKSVTLVHELSAVERLWVKAFRICKSLRKNLKNRKFICLSVNSAKLSSLLCL